MELADIRAELIRQEDSIIFTLRERAQFARNAPVYEPGALAVPGFTADGDRLSLLQYFLRETERLHGGLRRYTSPDEHPFFEETHSLVLPPGEFPDVLHPCAEEININGEVLALYLENLLPGLTQEGDDGNYGSSTLLDITALQNLSKRIHYGKFVAEAKFQSKPEEYGALIAAGDAAGLMELLTDEAVERKVVKRVSNKAALFGTDIQDVMGTISLEGLPDAGKIKPEVIADLYATWVMPLTKKVQVAYLLRRLES